MARAWPLIVALATLPGPARAGTLAAPPGTVRVFGHICEEPHLGEVTRAHPLPASAPVPRPKRGKRPGPAMLCALGDFGFSRGSVYLQLDPGQRVWLFDATDAGRLADAKPIATLELDSRGRLALACDGCDGQPTGLSVSDDGVTGGIWLELGGGRLQIRERGHRALAAAPGIAIKQRLFVAIPSSGAACGECDLMALAIFLPPPEARAWNDAVRALRPAR